jgi:hypothetical protein
MSSFVIETFWKLSPFSSMILCSWSRPRFTKGRKSYDFRLILRPLIDQVCDRFTKLVGMFFLRFPIYDLWLWSLLCGDRNFLEIITLFVHDFMFLINQHKFISPFHRFRNQLSQNFTSFCYIVW